MAHDLSIDEVTGKAAFFYLKADGPAWHGLGEGKDEITGASLRASKSFNFNVTKMPYLLPDGTRSKYAVAIMKHGEEIGTASPDYEVFQQWEFIEFVESVCGELGLKMKTAGVLGQGRRTWIMTTAPESFVIGNSDEHWPYITFTTSHDRSLSFCAWGGSVRVVCQNTLNMSQEDRDKNKTMIFSLQHSANMRSQVLAAKIQVLKILNKFAKVKSVHERLASYEVGEPEAYRILKGAVDTILIPDKKDVRESDKLSLDAALEKTRLNIERTKARRDITLDLALDVWEAERERSSKFYSVTDNAYLLANALTDIVERTGAYRGNEGEKSDKRWMDQMLGQRADQKIDIFDHVIQETIGRSTARSLMAA